MFRAIALALVLAVPGLATAQQVEERAAPFKQAGALDGAIGPEIANDSSFVSVPSDDVTEDLLRSARVIDEAGVRIGPITGLVYDSTNRIDALVVEVGGFLGIAAKPVRVDLAASAVGVSEEYGEVRVVLPYSETDLRNMDAFPAP